ncbi:ABC transporter substrate-binding protein [Paenibacillus swuensis]|uniref:ABC transporter substrate-binding protein n=1 Tax=Paenibacillus swuensis TaxID=1178515 RepID=A0A172TN83_9BACL|nr:extracellular solute-binding protein [Paenibacillus swuensis]ANE48549.1 ABC transporter substrate-binding protein [Paenibacillus swuensis]
MKKWSLMSLVFVMLIGLLAGCGSNNNNGGNAAKGTNETTNSGNTETPKEEPKKDVTLKIFNFKVEIAEAMNKMKAEYEAANPGVKLEIESVGGGADYGAALKAKVASGETPDIFNNGGYNEMNTWMEHLEDLSDQPWVADVVDAAKEPMTKDGKMYGMPMNLEGYGFLYNKDLFTKAGVTELPKTLTQLEEAAKKLEAAGITPFANGYQEWWILGIHNLNVAFANQASPDEFIKGLNEGTSKIKGNESFNNWSKLLDMTVKYGNKNPLTTDYNTQVTLFASGKAAMMQQGNWTQVQIDGIDPNLNLGVLPMPISEDAAANDKLYVGVPNNWVVNKNSKVKEEAKQFLNWLVTSEEGKKYIVNEFKFIPAFKSIEVTDQTVLGDIATDIITYSKEGKTLSWNWFKYPDGATQEFGSAMQAYIAKKSDKDGMFDAFQKTWDNLKK